MTATRVSATTAEAEMIAGNFFVMLFMGPGYGQHQNQKTKPYKKLYF